MHKNNKTLFLLDWTYTRNLRLRFKQNFLVVERTRMPRYSDETGVRVYGRHRLDYDMLKKFLRLKTKMLQFSDFVVVKDDSGCLFVGCKRFTSDQQKMIWSHIPK